MAPGFVAGSSVRLFTPANIVWVDENGDQSALTSAGVFGWSESPRLPAFRCETCGIIEVRYDG